MFIMCREVCKQVTLVLAAILVAFLIPKESHWHLTGLAAPNSKLKWTPEVRKAGIIHLHFVGTGELQWGGHSMWIENHTFMHLYGNLPEMTFFSDAPLKANAHVFA
jgi:hypothetical protein